MIPDLSSLYFYTGEITGIHDADTVNVSLDLGFGIIIKDFKIRLNGINAPEQNTIEGKISTSFMKSKLPIGSKVIIKTIRDKQEKYGRFLAEIYFNGENINDLLVSENKAKKWDGKGVRPV